MTEEEENESGTNEELTSASDVSGTESDSNSSEYDADHKKRRRKRTTAERSKSKGNRGEDKDESYGRRKKSSSGAQSAKPMTREEKKFHQMLQSIKLMEEREQRKKKGREFKDVDGTPTSKDAPKTDDDCPKRKQDKSPEEWSPGPSKKTRIEGRGRGRTKSEDSAAGAGTKPKRANSKGSKVPESPTKVQSLTPTGTSHVPTPNLQTTICTPLSGTPIANPPITSIAPAPIPPPATPGVWGLGGKKAFLMAQMEERTSHTPAPTPAPAPSSSKVPLKKKILMDFNSDVKAEPGPAPSTPSVDLSKEEKDRQAMMKAARGLALQRKHGPGDESTSPAHLISSNTPPTITSVASNSTPALDQTLSTTYSSSNTRPNSGNVNMTERPASTPPSQPRPQIAPKSETDAFRTPGSDNLKKISSSSQSTQPFGGPVDFRSANGNSGASRAISTNGYSVRRDVSPRRMNGERGGGREWEERGRRYGGDTTMEIGEDSGPKSSVIFNSRYSGTNGGSETANLNETWRSKPNMTGAWQPLQRNPFSPAPYPRSPAEYRR